MGDYRDIERELAEFFTGKKVRAVRFAGELHVAVGFLVVIGQNEMMRVPADCEVFNLSDLARKLSEMR